MLGLAAWTIVPGAHQSARRLWRARLGSAPRSLLCYHAPALILICGTSDDPWSRIDCALAAENLMLAAADAGLGTCWIGFAQGWFETDDGKAALGLPASCVPVAPIIVGHPKASTPPVPRKQPEIRFVG
jgi:nitroreductase